VTSKTPRPPEAAAYPPMSVIALLGQRDKPTDALHDYCGQLQHAFAKRGLALELAEVRWDRQGYLGALVRLWSQCQAWRGRWVLVQYTALSWSRHGFPFGALAVLGLVCRRGAKCVVVFHDAQGFYGLRVVDRLRRACQHWTMRQAYRLAHRSVFTIPVENIGWLPKKRVKATFIPIGANIPEPQGTSAETDPGTSRLKTVAVFGVTGGDRIAREVRDITYAMRCVSEKHSQLRLVVLGRNSTDAEVALRSALQGTGVVVQILGVIPAEEITRCLSLADVQLFVRGPIAATRGSAIAGIACGLPIVCYAGHETGFPITEAGLQLVPDGDRDALAVALDRVLSNDQLRRELRWRSLRAYADYFSWARIVEQFAMELTSG
jgi:glycosyltransferase involved in cell wall biosynthesis